MVHPADVYRLADVKHPEEADRVMKLLYGYLLYLKPGEKLSTSMATFSKISEDLIQVQTTIDFEDLVDQLEHKHVIKLPI